MFKEALETLYAGQSVAMARPAVAIDPYVEDLTSQQKTITCVH